MVPLFAVMLMAAPGPGPGNIIQIRERVVAPTPVTGLFLIPPKIPDCRTDAEIQQSLAEKANGVSPQSCDIPRSVQRQMRR